MQFGLLVFPNVRTNSKQQPWKRKFAARDFRQDPPGIAPENRRTPVRPVLGEATYGNVVLSCAVGNHVDLRGLPGGAEGIRTDGHRAAETAEKTQQTD